MFIPVNSEFIFRFSHLNWCSKVVYSSLRIHTNGADINSLTSLFQTVFPQESIQQLHQNMISSCITASLQAMTQWANWACARSSIQVIFYRSGRQRLSDTKLICLTSCCLCGVLKQFPWSNADAPAAHMTYVMSKACTSFWNIKRKSIIYLFFFV